MYQSGYAYGNLTIGLKMRYKLCWSVPSTTLLENIFPSLFQDVVLGSLESFF